MAKFFAELKAINPNVKIAYHSDGVIYPIIPDLIEIGMDVLNPIQPACMDPARLKRDYGDKLCFWGSIDEQHTLDLTEAVRQYALMATPMKALCKKDCAGLCQTCGKNLNEGKCHCPKDDNDLRWSKLAELK